jgi:hypothetical protein
MSAKSSRFVWVAMVLVSFMHVGANAFYDPVTQRWLNRDPLGDNARLAYPSPSHADETEASDVSASSLDQTVYARTQIDLHPMRFVRNNPMIYVDPFGEVDCPAGLGHGSLNPANLEALQTPAQVAAAVARRSAISKLQQSKLFGKGLEGSKKIDTKKLKDLLNRDELQQAKKIAQDGIDKAKELLNKTSSERTREKLLEQIETQLNRLKSCGDALK